MKFCRFLPFLLVPFLTSCNGGSEPEKVGAPKAAEPEFKVALLTPGPVNDAGWNALAGDGLEGIKEALGAKTDSQQASGTQIRDAFRSYAQQGYNLIIGHGYEYNAPAAEVAKDFPDTVFVTSSGGMTAKNVGAFRFTLEEGFYLAGIMAARMSKTGKIGSVSLGGIPSIDSTLDAFEAGARSVRPDVQIKRVRISDDKDISAAQQATDQLASNGVDWVIHQANNAAQGVFNSAKAHGIHAIGANFDQNSNPTGVVAASAIIIARPAFVALAREVKEKKYTGRIQMVSMKDGAIELRINPAFQNQVPEGVKKTLENRAQLIMDGKLKVPMAQF